MLVLDLNPPLVLSEEALAGLARQLEETVLFSPVDQVRQGVSVCIHGCHSQEVLDVTQVGFDQFLHVDLRADIRVPLISQEKGSANEGESPEHDGNLVEVVLLEDFRDAMAIQEVKHLEFIGTPSLVVVAGCAVDLVWNAGVRVRTVDSLENIIFDAETIVAFVVQDEALEQEVAVTEKQLMHWVDREALSDLESQEVV